MPQITRRGFLSASPLASLSMLPSSLSHIWAQHLVAPFPVMAIMMMMTATIFRPNPSPFTPIAIPVFTTSASPPLELTLATSLPSLFMGRPSTAAAPTKRSESGHLFF